MAGQGTGSRHVAWLCLSEELKSLQEGYIAWKIMERFLLSGQLTGHRKADRLGCLCEGWFLRCWNFPSSQKTYPDHGERKLARN